LHWLSVGAQPTDTVRTLLKNLGTLERFARLKAGEELEKLLAEAEDARANNLEQAESVEEVAVASEEDPAEAE